MMNLSILRGKLCFARRLLVPTVVALFCIFAVSAPFADTSGLNVTSVPLPGVSGGANNVVFFADRYALVAPFCPSRYAALGALPDCDSLDDLYYQFLHTI